MRPRTSGPSVPLQHAAKYSQIPNRDFNLGITSQKAPEERLFGQEDELSY